METTDHALSLPKPFEIARNRSNPPAAQVSYADLDFASEGVALVLGNEEIGVDTAVMEQLSQTRTLTSTEELF